MQFIIKTVVSALIIAMVSTLSRKMPLLGAIIVSLPITSILAMVWLYAETKDADKVASLSMSIFWVVVPSIVFFAVMALVLRRGLGFYPSLVTSSLTMIAAYWLYIKGLTSLGVRF